MSTSTLGLTPYRKVWVRFDLAEYTLREPSFNLWRNANQIAIGHAGQALSNHWHFLAPNAIVCEPWQADPSNLHEKTDTPGAIVNLSNWQTIDGVVERNTWKAPTDLTGVTVDSSVAATGDPFMQKTVTAGTTWSKSLTGDISAFGQYVMPNVNITIDRVALTHDPFPNNQAFNVRLVVPAMSPQSLQVIGIFYFGGPVSGDSSLGTFCLAFYGSGHMDLLEKFDSGDGNGPNAFHLRTRWQAFHNNGAKQTIRCQIWPHFMANGSPVINFLTDKSAPQQGSSGSPLTSYYGGGFEIDTHVYHIDPRSRPAMPNLPVTGPAPARIDIRRDIRPPVQVSVLRHVYAALIVDDPFSVDFFPTTNTPLRLYWQAYVPDGTAVDGALFDYVTGDELELLDSGDGFKVYKVSVGQPYYFAEFSLTPSADGKLTPVFYGYKVVRDAWIDSIAPGEQDVPNDAIIRQLSISGPDKDFTHETCSLTLDDPSANLSKINIRARVRTRIETEYDPSDSTKRSVLFDGFVDRADARLKGWRGNQGLSQGGAAAVYPSPQWKEFACSFSGIWRRLREKLTMQRIMLGAGQDGVTDAQGVQQPYKVTDIARALIEQCGFAPSQIDVPDSPIRFYPGSDGGGDETTIEPLAEIGDTVANMLHDYLGWFLVWDANAGASGMMRAIAPPPLQGPYTPLANFTLDSAGAGKLQMRPESYGSIGWYATQSGSSVSIPTVAIRKKTFQTHVKPPEANAVHVTGTGLLLPSKSGQYQLNQWAWNPLSYDFFVDGSGIPVHTADPTSPDYLGEFIPLVVVNTSLSQQHSVDILTRRLYDVACHAQKWAMFDAPLPLVIDPNDPNQRVPRPLRYYDAVTIQNNGVLSTWIVRSCNPYLLRGKDAYSMAHMELLNVD